jgi:hypothetical protein
MRKKEVVAASLSLLLAMLIAESAQAGYHDVGGNVPMAPVVPTPFSPSPSIFLSPLGGSASPTFFSAPNIVLPAHPQVFPKDITWLDLPRIRDDRAMLAGIGTKLVSLNEYVHAHPIEKQSSLVIPDVGTLVESNFNGFYNLRSGSLFLSIDSPGAI